MHGQYQITRYVSNPSKVRKLYSSMPSILVACSPLKGTKKGPTYKHHFQMFHFTFDTYPTYSEAKVTQSCPTLCNPMDYIVHGILQARILEWVAFPFSGGSFQPRD